MQETKFESVLNTANEGNGELVIIRGGNSITAGVKTPLILGVVAEGRYEGAVSNKFNPDKMDYKIRAENGTLFILAECAALKRNFAEVTTGELLRVSFEGKRSVVSKTLGKISVNDYVVERAING